MSGPVGCRPDGRSNWSDVSREPYGNVLWADWVLVSLVDQEAIIIENARRPAKTRTTLDGPFFFSNPENNSTMFC